MPPATTIKFSSTECSQANCGPEAACFRQQSGLYTCICPHDFSQPVDGKCPRIVVSGHPATIPSLIPRFKNSTKLTADSAAVFEKQQTLLSPLESTSTIAAWSLGCSLLMVVVLTLVWIWWRRRSRPSSSQKHPSNHSPPPATTSPPEKTTSQMLVSLSKATLLETRFMTNPNYWALDTLDAENIPEVPIVPRDSVLLLHEIGEGCFGKVFKGQLKENSLENEPEIVAVKVLKDSATAEAREDFFREAGIMASFQHRNILSLRGLVINESQGRPWMLFEYMSYGDLAQLLRANSSQHFPGSGSSLRLTERDLYDIGLQIAAGMSYLSSHHFVHRDLACRNCLVGQDLTVKISDFGMSRDVYTCDYYKIGGSRMLPVRWMSPESIMYGKFTLESDVWSYGVVLWEIYSCAKQPYYGHSNEEVVKLILQGILMTPPQDAPLLICDVMRGCWKTQPSHRLTFNQIYDKLLANQRQSFHRKKSSSSGANELHVAYSNIVQSSEQLDSQNYLVPKTQAMAEYLQPLPDLQSCEPTYSNGQ